MATRPSRHDRDRVAVALEIEPQQVAEPWLILDHQDPGTATDMAAHPSGRSCQGVVKTNVPFHTRSSSRGVHGRVHDDGRSCRPRSRDLRGLDTMSSYRLARHVRALVVRALVGGTLISVVAAAPGASPATALAGPAADAVAAAPAAIGTYCEAFRTAFAANLGVDRGGPRRGSQGGSRHDDRQGRRRRHADAGRRRHASRLGSTAADGRRLRVPRRTRGRTASAGARPWHATA